MNVTKTAAYAAVATSKFSGVVLENTATPSANRNMDVEITACIFAVVVSLTRISIGITIIRPPITAKLNRLNAIRIFTRRSWSATVCARSVPRLEPMVVLCCISCGLKDPKRSESRNMLVCDLSAVRFSSDISAAWSRDPRPSSSLDAAMSLTKYVFHRLAWMNSKSRKASAAHWSA